MYIPSSGSSRNPGKNIHESHPLRFARSTDRSVDKPRLHANYSLTKPISCGLCRHCFLLYNTAFSLSTGFRQIQRFFHRTLFCGQPSNSNSSSLVKDAESIPSPSKTCSASFFLRSWISMIFSSMVPSDTSLYTVTTFFCPIRCARSVA